jgi:glycosyltransferase involved in cell wall biosynthesis
MPHILFISYDGLTDPLGQSQIIPYLKGLTAYGYRFTILSSEKPEKFNTHKNSIAGSLKGVPIKWYPIQYHKNPPVISAVWDVYLMKRAAKKLHRVDPFDMVHTRSGTPALVGLWMKKKFGIKFLNDIRDFYAESRIDSGQWNKSNPIYRKVYHFFKKKEEEQLQLCDGVVCLTNTAKNILKGRLKNKELPFQVIPCSADMELFNPQRISGIQKQVQRKKLGLANDDYIITYLGSIGTWYLINELMDFFNEAIKKIPNVRLLFICPDPVEAIKELIRQHNISSEKIVIIKAARNEVPLLLSLGHFSVFFIKQCYSKQASSPTKHGEMMAMGIPVITNSGVGDLDEIIDKTASGFIVKKVSQEEYNAAISQMTHCHFDPQKIRSSALEYYNLDNAVLKYKDVYDSILLNAKPGKD